ncbi:MAG: glucosidase, partial [Planctomycetota bacterium JB042]
GNHGEDVKEVYHYLDSTPTHSWMRALYRYPRAAFPYERLREENARRTRRDPEFELLDTGVFDEGHFDVEATYAKAGPNDVLIRLAATNRSDVRETLHLLPTLWFRNTWSWGCEHEGCWPKPRLAREDDGTIVAHHVSLGVFRLAVGPGPDGAAPPLLFTENETNARALFGSPNEGATTKDAFHARVVGGREDAVAESGRGTKAAAWHRLELDPGETATVDLRLFSEDEAPPVRFGRPFEETLARRAAEADAFYEPLHDGLDEDGRRIGRQAAAGLLWTKQFYHYDVRQWQVGDPAQPAPPPGRRAIRNEEWGHLFNRDVLSMPDKWEYPWFAAWDLAFHVVPFARLDPHFAKAQLVLLLREWYMHPNGQIPAYEWEFSDVNPPVHAWAAWRVYRLTREHGEGRGDRVFLARVFHKLVLNFTWWVNRKDPEGNNLFSGGFLGLDNIGLFDRSKPLPDGGRLEQADGTAWMIFFCGTMMNAAIELAIHQPALEDMASKFFEHYVAIVEAFNALDGTGLWDEEDGFYYDHLHCDGTVVPLRVRSMVGIVPLFAVLAIDREWIDVLPGFKKRMDWFLENRPELARHVVERTGRDGVTRVLLSAVPKDRLERILARVLDEDEFLSPYGVRSMSRAHRDAPFRFRMGGREHEVRYLPGESDSGLFGGNSNWRGPVWFPMNYLLIEALERYELFFDDALTVECPTGSGVRMDLREVAREIARRQIALFRRDEDGRRPSHGDDVRFRDDPTWRDTLLFHEYFHGDDGRGLGASHQTGWTALVARLLEKYGRAAGDEEERD